ncbi:MAG: endonuclease/exonuclease/phosphatase family protein [Sphingopyxis sp.]|uniref:endonuclease/exonuclease/phosphatase family protein n=1 Tax=Sphingopyxis sp. TaxID=1908224 RepID=UPI001A19C2AD|nr:endonuclease/exonuclease/phosphatase family protein [Sphingopyxis sp.]MBJ7499599.1 endonuclease/exonuclease/phosphatase family protein [Sphingopyxis sp.]
MRRIAAAAAIMLLAGGCASWPKDRYASCPNASETPVITRLADGRQSTTLSVLIYNVEGLPWPARKKRGPSLDRIGQTLAAFRAEGRAPDIVLMQETFTSRAARIGAHTGYANAIGGPKRSDMVKDPAVAGKFVAERRRKKGERGPKLMRSGLYVLSDFPVTEMVREGYARNACAGFDCLAAKGMMLVRATIPGVPSPIDIFTTHMNAGRAARVSLERSGEAHHYQALEAAHFLDEYHVPDNPLIIGGDFNMRRNPGRFDFFSTAVPYTIVHRWCIEKPAACDVKMSWDGDAPWLDTQDLQAFDNGKAVSVEPIRVEAMFDGSDNGARLSDHDGFLVTYRLSWREGAQGAVDAQCPVAPGQAARRLPGFHMG